MPRAFVAIDIEDLLRRRLVEVQGELARTGAHLKLVEPQNIHITMKFLGEVRAEILEALAGALQRALKGKRAFEIQVRGVGVFPNLNYMRVVWAGVSRGREELVAIQQSIDRELEGLGFKPERDFIPHLTLARVKSPVRKERLVAMVKRMSGMEFGTTKAKSVELKQSTLTPRGPIYSTLAEVKLAEP